MMIKTIKEITRIDYRDFVRDDNRNLVHKSTIKKSTNVKHKGNNNDKSKYKG